MKIYSDELKTLCFDVATNKLNIEDFEAAQPDTEKLTPDDAIRKQFYEILGVESGTDRKLASRLYTRRDALYELIIDTIAGIFPNIFANNPFMDKFVEYKDINWGDTKGFTVEDNSLFRVSKFAGWHWDTDRQKIHGRKTIIVETEAFYIHVYDELIKFLTNKITFEGLIKKIQTSIMYDVQQRIYANFNNAPILLPNEFIKNSAFDRDEMITLAETVRTATGQTPVITGTKMALSKLVTSMTDPWISDSMKNEQNKTGMIGNWEGYSIMPIPAAFKPGTFEFKDDINRIYILPETNGESKFIKVVNEGYPLIRDSKAAQDNQDMTLDYQIQYFMGVATVFNALYGVYTLA